MEPTCCVFLLLAMAAQHPVPFERSGQWGYKDSGGGVVIQPRFDMAEPFSAEGLAAVVDGRGWAYIDSAGHVVIRPLVVDNGPDYFREDLARFRRGGRVGFFDSRGKVVIQPRFDFAMPFSEGLAAVCQGCKEVPVDEHTSLQAGKWGYIDRRGTLVIPLTFEQAGSFEDGRARVKSSGQWEQIDRHGQALPERSIGVAWMEPDGTIVLQLRAEGRGGTIDDTLIRRPRGHPQYDATLQHLGGLKPGERKAVYGTSPYAIPRNSDAP